MKEVMQGFWESLKEVAKLLWFEHNIGLWLIMVGPVIIILILVECGLL
jgi:hypothetical protein